MSANVLTTSSRIQCPHGGQVLLITSNTRVSANGSFVLLESDEHQVAGCTFYTGSNPSPCLSVKWSAGASKVKVSGKPVLIQTSIGTCYNVQNIPQGVAIIVNTQMRASAQ